MIPHEPAALLRPRSANRVFGRDKLQRNDYLMYIRRTSTHASSFARPPGRRPMETNQRDRLPSAANEEFWSHSMVQAILVLVLCYLAARLGGTLIITAPQTLWPLARLRSLGGHSAGFSTKDLAHPYSSRSGRFCPLRPPIWRTDSFDGCAPTGRHCGNSRCPLGS